MAKTSISDLKARFKRGMYPTEGDFANVFDSYVHKDDGIDIENVTTGNGSKTLTVLLQEIKEATVTEAVEAAKNEFPEIPELPEGLAEFIQKVNSFLEDADASNETINKWKEVEAFLSGITDTETLTGLLADLKSEIIGEVDGKLETKADKSTVEALDERVKALEEGSDEDEPKLDCLKVIADLDASNAPIGTIAIYTGDTNDKYTHGFIYEKKGEEGKVIPAGSPLSVPLGGYTNSPLYGKQIVNTGRMVDLQPWADKCPSWSGVANKLAQVVAKTGSSMGYEAVTYDGSLVIYYAPMDSNNYLAFYDGVESMSYGFDQIGSSITNTLFASAVTDHDIILPEGDGAPSWTPLNVMNVIG